MDPGFKHHNYCIMIIVLHVSELQVVEKEPDPRSSLNFSGSFSTANRLFINYASDQGCIPLG